MKSAPAAAAAPGMLPWPMVAVIVLGGGAIAAASLLLLPQPAGILATSAGLGAGSIAVLNARPKPAALAVLLSCLASLLVLAVPTAEMRVGVGAGLTMLAAWESARGPGRAAIGALFGWVLLLLTPESASMPLWTGAVFLAAGIAPVVAFSMLGAAGRGMERQTTLGPFAAAMAGVYLFFGVAMASWAVLQFDHPKAYWIAVIFVLRALEPPETRVPAAVRFGIGASMGVLLALGVEALALPTPVHPFLALTLIVLGLRFMPRKDWIAPAAFSAAVLLATARTLEDALMRFEAVVIAVSIAVAITLFASIIWSLAVGSPSETPRAGRSNAP